MELIKMKVLDSKSIITFIGEKLMDVNHYLMNGWKYLQMARKCLNVTHKKFSKI
jgi:hypothetical protein